MAEGKALANLKKSGAALTGMAGGAEEVILNVERGESIRELCKNWRSPDWHGRRQL